MPSNNDDKAEVSSIASGVPLLVGKTTQEKSKKDKTGGKSSGKDKGKQSDVSSLLTNAERSQTNAHPFVLKKKSQKPDIFENPKAFPMAGPNIGAL